MASRNKRISNPTIGQQIDFILTAKDTNGQLLEMKATYNLNSKEPAAHYHPFQAEDFTVLSGELTARINGKIITIKQGEQLHIPKMTVHSMWNQSGEKTVLSWKVRPAMKTENLLETAAGLASDGKTNGDGMPNILQVALMANKYSDEFRLARPPFVVQKILFLILTPFAYLFGYRPTYQKYLD